MRGFVDQNGAFSAGGTPPRASTTFCGSGKARRGPGSSVGSLSTGRQGPFGAVCIQNVHRARKNHCRPVPAKGTGALGPSAVTLHCVFVALFCVKKACLPPVDKLVRQGLGSLRNAAHTHRRWPGKEEARWHCAGRPSNVAQKRACARLPRLGARRASASAVAAVAAPTATTTIAATTQARVKRIGCEEG